MLLEFNSEKSFIQFQSDNSSISTFSRPHSFLGGYEICVKEIDWDTLFLPRIHRLDASLFSFASLKKDAAEISELKSIYTAEDRLIKRNRKLNTHEKTERVNELSLKLEQACAHLRHTQASFIGVSLEPTEVDIQLNFRFFVQGKEQSPRISTQLR